MRNHGTTCLEEENGAEDEERGEKKRRPFSHLKNFAYYINNNEKPL